MGFLKKMAERAVISGYDLDKVAVPYRNGASYSYDLFNASEAAVEAALIQSQSHAESEFFRRPILFLKRSKQGAETITS